MDKRIASLNVLMMILVSGCAPIKSGYPDVTSAPTDQSTQPCHQCGRTISSATNDHSLTIGAAQYIVCSDDCRKKQIAWHESQFGK